MNRIRQKTKFLSCALFSFFLCMSTHAQDVISLAGAWDFACSDNQPAGYDDYVILPGSMLTNGKGNPVSVRTQWTGSLYDSSFYFNPYMAKYRTEGQMKFPFFLTPDKHYTGAAWYHKKVYVPNNWKDRRVTLFLERPHIETVAYVNGRKVGQQSSLSTPHRYDITDCLKFGASNDIAIRVYNGIEHVCVGQDSHSVTDQTQGNWNGIVGRLELQAQWKKLNIRKVSIQPDLKAQTVTVSLQLENHFGGVRFLPMSDYWVNADIRLMNGNQAGPVLRFARQEAKSEKLSFTFPINGLPLWDEFSPTLYRLTISTGDDYYETQFGLRDISIEGRQLLINGRPLFLRGTVENCCFPETGYPPTDEDEWIRIFRKCKEYGLNHMRFHSYCPPDAAFSAADKTGIYLQPEGPSWPNHGVRLRRGMAIDQYLLEESKRIIDEYGHHPSFVMMAAGNEPAGDWVTYCNQWVKEMKQYDPTKLYAGASVGGGWAWDSASEFHVKGGARGLDDWNRRAPSSDDDYYSGIEYPRNYKDKTPNQTPIVTHEKGQWCAFPDFKEIPQYTGVYKARNFEIFRDLLNDNGMGEMGEKFLMASGRLQTLCYKYEIERHLRTKDYAGFQLLGLNDYSGQGTALVGVLNVHWREKGYCTASDWRQFCSPIVPLARFPRFVFSNADTLCVPVEVYNAFSAGISDVKATYTVHDDNQQVLASGRLTEGVLPVGKCTPIGKVLFPLNGISRPAKLTLTVQLSPQIRNHWEFWVYPAEMDNRLLGMKNDGDFFMTDDYQLALGALKKGKTVLLTAAGKVTLGNDVKQNYLPVFWNTSWFKMRPPHTTGAYIDTTHPLFKHDFPTDSWSNLNWWELLNKAQVMNLRELPASYQPPIQPIDTWHVSRKLGMLIEAKVGKGRLLMTTMDISSNLDHRLVARQMRHAIVSYMLSPDFNPTTTLTPVTIADFFTKTAPKVDMFTNESPDELKPVVK